MMLPSHLLATLLVCAILALRYPLSAKEWRLAVAFGVLIDLDHLLQFPAYVASHGAHGLTPAAMLQWGASWQGLFHTPWALLLVLPACFVFSSWMPALFWLLHMFQDFVVATRFVRFGSALEWAIDALLLAGVVALAVRDHRAHGRHLALPRHVLTRAMMALPRR